jgi:hypothetical protein
LLTVERFSMITMPAMQTVRVSLQPVPAALSLILAICSATVALAAPPTDHSYVVSLRRLTEQEYRNSIGDIFGKEIEVRGSFEPAKRTNGLAAVSTALLSVTPVGFESFKEMADDIAAQVTAEKYRAKLPCAPKDPKAPDDACASKIINQYGRLLFRRPLTCAELDNRVGLSHRIAKQTNAFYAGLRYSLSMLLQLPDFIFRSELAIPSADGEFQNSGLRMRALLRSMALSDSFYAAAPPANPSTNSSKEVALK